MLTIEQIQNDLYDITRKKYEYVKILSNGRNNQAVLVKDEDGQPFVCRYGLDKKTNNFCTKLVYKFKRLRRKFLLYGFLKCLNSDEITFIKKKISNAKNGEYVQNLISSFDTNIKVPHEVNFGKYYIGKYCGTSIEGILNNDALINKFQKDMAQFLASLHGISYYDPLPTPLYKKISSHLRFVSSCYGLKNWQSNAIPQELKNSLNSAKLFLDASGNSDEVRAVAHNDLRKGNILIDKNNFSVIDWDRAGINNIYYEFLQLGAFNNGFSANIVKGLVEEYNKQAKFKIDMQKLKNLLIIFKLDDFGKYSVLEIKSKKNFIEELNSKVLPMINELNSTFDNFDKSNENFKQI